uniref:Uncharacterized protein n=1 Tax=Ditylenchus dipsaci TaxID=166011 RepID=A0A915D8N8_9BILA
MDGHQNQQQGHYSMNFGGMAGQQQQQAQLQLQQQQARLQQQQQQQQEYSQLFFNQQNYLNMPMIYNSTQNLQQQSIDMQALQRQQQILQALNPQNQLQAVQQHQLPQQQAQQSLILDQNIASQSPMSQHLQQQLYASSVQQQFQANLQHQQQPSSHLEHLAALQNGALLHSSSQSQHHTPVQQQQPHFYQKPNDYLMSQTPNIGAGSLLAQQQQLHHQQVLRQQQPQQQSLSTPLNHPRSQMQQMSEVQQQMAAHQQQQQLRRKSREENPTMKSPTLKSPVVNANAENARILKEREEELLAHKKDQEAKEKQRIQEELKRNKEVAKEFADTLSERIRSFPEPLHLATCHTLSKVSAFMPFPSECAATSSSLPCFDSQRAQTVLSNVDVNLAQYLSSILAETAEEIRDIFNQDAYHVDFQSEWSEIEQAFGKDIQEAVARVTAEEDAALAGVFTQQHHQSHSQATSSQPVSTNVVSEELPSIPSTSHTPLTDCQADSMTAEAAQQIGRDQTQLRKQMVSVGKQPKAAPGRRKRDMVESLYDSLTGYFDPSKDRRRRRGGRAVTSDDEDSESLVDKQEEPNEPSSSTKTESSGPKTSDLNEESVGSDADENRPTTPTEIIHQRELEWHERQKQRQEKFKRRQTEADLDCWNNEVMAENESFCKFTNIIDQILDQMEDFDIVHNEAGVDINQELLIERSLLDELRMEAQKLKSWRKINKVNTDRLVKLIMVLERNIRDVLNDEGLFKYQLALMMMKMSQMRLIGVDG